MWQLIFYALIASLILYLLRCYFRGKKCVIYRPLKDKIIVITGGSKGIGQETIKQLAQYECKVYFGSRNKPTNFLNELKISHPHFNIEYIYLDLQDWASI